MTKDRSPSGPDSILQHQRAAYSEHLRQHGDSPLGVCWNNKETQNLRFDRLFAQLLPQGAQSTYSFSVHDLGCGTAALHQRLLERGIMHEYSGTDIVEEMALAARRKFPNIKISVRDFLSDTGTESYDYVVASGVFNFALGTDRAIWKEYVLQMIRKMFLVCRKAIAFNFLTTYRDFDDPRLAYFDPREVFDYCHDNLSRFIQLDAAYPLFEVTATIFKSESLRTLYEPNIYGKYFKSSLK